MDDFKWKNDGYGHFKWNEIRSYAEHSHDEGQIRDGGENDNLNISNFDVNMDFVT